MTTIIKSVRFGLLIATTVGLFACGGQIAGDNNSSSSSSSSSSTSSTSSTSSSSSNSSSGCPAPPHSSSSSSSSTSSSGQATIAVNQYCPTSVGIDHGTHFEIENSANGRIDFPEVGKIRAPYLHSGRGWFQYSNPNDTPVQMQLWTDSSLKAIDIELPPSEDIWGFYSFELGDAHQVSFTVTEANGSFSIRNTKFVWETLPGFENLLEIGECPVHPLPGVGDTTPQSPTAQIKARNSPCEPWGTQVVGNPVSKDVEFDASDSTDLNIEPLNYFWDFRDGNTATGKQVIHAFADPGFYLVDLTVADASGRSDKDTILVAVHDTDQSNNAPTPVITLNRKNLLKPFTETTLWGDVSYDVDGDELDHVWYTNFTDEIVFGAEVNVEVPAEGVWNEVRLGVSDGRGGIRYKTQRITVADYPGEDCEITYDASATISGMNVRIYNNTSLPRQNWTATWHADNDVPNLRLRNPVSGDRVALDIADSRSFTVSGEYIPEYSWISFHLSFDAALQDVGFKPQNGMKCVEHFPPSRAQSPYARILVYDGGQPGLINFNADISDDPEREKIFSYLWDFGDGTKSFERSGTHQYSYASNFKIKLTVSQGPLTAEGKSNGALTASFYEDFRVFGDQYVACYPSVTPTEKKDEYLIKAIYWDTSFTHGYPDPKFFGVDPVAVTLNSGQITFSTPVVITQADSATGILLDTPIDDVSFAINKVVEPGATASVQMTAVIEDLDTFYFTSCTFQ